jgi:hypothetical protein
VSKYWVEHAKYGCPIGGPFDLWRQNYFMANGEPPEDTAKLYPDLSSETVTAVAVATINDGATLDHLLITFGDRGPSYQLTMAHTYFSERRKSAPFMPDSMQDIPRRWEGTAPEPLEDFHDDWRRVIDADKPTE